MIKFSDEWGFSFSEVLESVLAFGRVYSRANWKGKAFTRNEHGLSIVDGNGNHVELYGMPAEDIFAKDWCRVWIETEAGK